MGKRKAGDQGGKEKKKVDTSGDALDDDFVAEDLGRMAPAIPALDGGSDGDLDEEEMKDTTREKKREKKEASLEASKVLKKMKQEEGRIGNIGVREQSAMVSRMDAQGQVSPDLCAG